MMFQTWRIWPPKVIRTWMKKLMVIRKSKTIVMLVKKSKQKKKMTDFMHSRTLILPPENGRIDNVHLLSALVE